MTKRKKTLSASFTKNPIKQKAVESIAPTFSLNSYIKNEFELKTLLNISLAQALCKPELIDDINRAFAVNPKVYYQKFRELEKVYNPFIPLIPSNTYPYFEKISGIIEHSVATSNFVQVYSLLKKAYPTIFKLMKNSNYIRPERLEGLFFQKDVNEFEQEYTLTIFFFMKNSEYQSSRKIVYTIPQLEELLYKQLEINLERKVNSALTYQGNVISMFEKAIFNPVHDSVPALKDVAETMNPFVALGRKIKAGFEEYEEKHQKPINSIEERYVLRGQYLRSGTSSSLFSALQLFMARFGFFENFIDVDLNNEDIYNLNLLFTEFKKDYKFTIDDDHLTVISLVLVSVLKEFQALRPLIKKTDAFVDFEKESEILKLKKEIVSFEEREKQQKSSSDLEIAQLRAALSKANADLQQKDKTIAELTRENSLFDDKEIELQRLREVVRSQIDENLIEENPTSVIDNFIESLQTKNLLFIGGHDNWIAKMKAILPKATFYDVEATLSNSLSQIDNMDYVIINTLRNSHGAFDKVINRLSDRKKLLYTNKVSTKETLNELYKQIH